MTDQVAITLITSLAALITSVVLGYFTYKLNHEKNLLDADVKDLQEALADLRDKFVKAEKKNQILWSYLIANMEHMRRKGVKPVDPPNELKSDPELARFFIMDREKRRVSKVKRGST